MKKEREFVVKNNRFVPDEDSIACYMVSWGNRRNQIELWYE